LLVLRGVRCAEWQIRPKKVKGTRLPDRVPLISEQF
jgi:hypothetical protein